jgi:hypothetical protein
MALVLMLVVALDFERVRSVVGSGALVAAGLLVVAAIGIGFVTGGTSAERRRVLALGTGQRGARGLDGGGVGASAGLGEGHGGSPDTLLWPSAPGSGSRPIRGMDDE